MDKYSDIVTIRFFCIEKNDWVRYWAPGKSGPKPSTLPLPPKIWSKKNVMNNVNHDDSKSDNDSYSDNDSE